MALIELFRRTRAEPFRKRFFKRACWVVHRKQLDDVVVAESNDPRAVVENLGDDLPRGAVALQFNDNQVTLSVDRKEVDTLAERRGHLPSDEHYIEPEDVNILGKHGFQPVLIRHRRRRETRQLTVKPPDSNLDAHLASSRQPRTAQIVRDVAALTQDATENKERGRVRRLWAIPCISEVVCSGRGTSTARFKVRSRSPKKPRTLSAFSMARSWRVHIRRRGSTVLLACLLTSVFVYRVGVNRIPKLRTGVRSCSPRASKVSGVPKPRPGTPGSAHREDRTHQCDGNIVATNAAEPHIIGWQPRTRGGAPSCTSRN